MELFVSGCNVVRDASQQHNEPLGFVICGGNFCVADKIFSSQEEIYSLESAVCRLQVNI
jgi:hypothetical protein